MPRRRPRDLLPLVAIAFLFALIVAVYTPATVYAGNERLFYFPLVQVLPVLGIAVLCITIALVVPGLLLPSRARRFYLAFLGAFVVFAWLRGFLLVADYGLLDGDVTLPTPSPGALAVSIGMILLAWALLSLRAIKPKNLALLATVIALAMLAHTGVLVARDTNPVRSLAAQNNATYTLGRQNVIVVLLDSMQSDVFAEVVDDHPEIAAGLEGFTYFPNTLGGGPTTYGSLPVIHSGSPRPPGASMRRYFDDAIVNRSFLSDLADHDWDVTLLNPLVDSCPVRIGRCFLFDPNRSSGTRTHLYREAAELGDLSLFRLAPPELKGSIYNQERWLLRRSFDAQSNVVASDNAIREFTSSVRVGGSEKTAHFLHLFSTHPPATRDGDCKLLPEPTKMFRPEALEVTLCALRRLSSLVARLKELQVYDETSMVLLSDHGFASMPSPRIGGEQEWRELVGRANATLAVKEAGATGEMETSDTQLSLADVRTIVCSLTQGCGAPVVAWKSFETNRPRSFLSYRWGDRFWLAETLQDERRFEVQGPMFDAASWAEQREAPVPDVEFLTFGPRDAAAHYGFGWGKYTHAPGDHSDPSRWAVGSKASVFVRLPKSSSCHVRFRLGALPEHKRQRVEFRVNGRIVADVPLRTESEVVDLAVPRTISALKSADQIAMYFTEHRYSESRGDLDAVAARFDDLTVRCGGTGVSVLPPVRRST